MTSISSLSYYDPLKGNKAVTYYELDTTFGHDTFILDLTNVGGAMKVTTEWYTIFHFNAIILNPSF